MLWGNSLLNQKVEQAADNLAHSDLTRKEFSRLQDSFRHWMHISDLILSSRLFYLTKVERQIRSNFDEGLEDIGRSPFAEAGSDEHKILLAFASRHEARMEQALALTNENIEDELIAILRELNQDSDSAINALGSLGLKIRSGILTANSDYAVAYRDRVLISGVLVLFFLLLIAGIWRSVSHRLSHPLEQLSSKSRAAIVEGGLIDRVTVGPREIVDLSDSVASLFESMDAKVRDRTQHLDLVNQQLDVARLAAESANQAKSDFLANVSHELRTPLSSIRAAGAILLRYSDEDKTVREEFAEIIVLESDRLTRLINDLLDLGKIEAHEERFYFQELQVEETLFYVVRASNVDQSSSGVDVQLEVVGDLPTSFADRDRLHQMWTNLIGNAVKFSPADATVQVRAEAHDDTLVIEIRDHGPGIPSQELESIFERFRQVSQDSLIDKPQGTGLGLAIARSIAGGHGGHIEVESELGVGSTFRVILPILTRAPDNSLEPSTKTARMSGLSDSVDSAT